MSTHFDYLPEEVQYELKCVADTLLTPLRGILTADESASTIGKRFAEIGLQNDEHTRAEWRQVLFSSDHRISDYISGVALSHEALSQKDRSGKLLVDYIKERCMIPGIKVDYGLVPLPGSEDEVVTQGLHNLAQRLAEYKKWGCEFARWRCVFQIGKNTPSYRALVLNTNLIAQFASVCQSQRICPLIEPEVSPVGSHDIVQCQKVTETVLSFVFRALHDHHVYLEGIILKPNMIMAGMSSEQHRNPEHTASATLTALRRTVPPAVPGICFSSDGQTEEEATVNLQLINLQDREKPWRLTFAYGRALQASALKIWKGDKNNVQAAQEEFLRNAQANSFASAAREQEYAPELHPIESVEFEKIQPSMSPYSRAGSESDRSSDFSDISDLRETLTSKPSMQKPESTTSSYGHPSFSKQQDESEQPDYQPPEPEPRPRSRLQTSKPTQPTSTQSRDLKKMEYPKMMPANSMNPPTLDSAPFLMSQFDLIPTPCTTIPFGRILKQRCAEIDSECQRYVEEKNQRFGKDNIANSKASNAMAQVSPEKSPILSFPPKLPEALYITPNDQISSTTIVPPHDSNAQSHTANSENLFRASKPPDVRSDPHGEAKTNNNEQALSRDRKEIIAPIFTSDPNMDIL